MKEKENGYDKMLNELKDLTDKIGEDVLVFLLMLKYRMTKSSPMSDSIIQSEIYQKNRF